MGELKEAGVSSIPGGGAEVFSNRVRSDLFWTKSDSDEWLQVARTAHDVGLHTNATMLYGHIENPAEKAEHLAAADIKIDMVDGKRPRPHPEVPKGPGQPAGLHDECV